MYICVKIQHMLAALFNKYKVSEIAGKYITNSDLELVLDKFHWTDKTQILGYSENGKPIYMIKIGKGAKNILMWSQMHGNESTTTKGLIDFIHFLTTDSIAEKWLENFSFFIIPILNPDGAQNYTRVNQNLIDLNRDAFEITQKESKLLRQLIDSLEIEFAFNLHDQRTIFSAGESKNPATMSFLAPAYNEDREINETRLFVMQLISDVYTNLHQDIPNKIGRFDDSFNINCIGDYLTTRNIPTVLFEAGFYPNDYQREETRKFVFNALFYAIQSLFTTEYKKYSKKDYFHIPENDKRFYDFLITDIQNSELKIGVQFKEELEGREILFVPEIDKNQISKGFYGHIEITEDIEKLSKYNSEEFKNFCENFVKIYKINKC